jgi:hypothetical protein
VKVLLVSRYFPASGGAGVALALALPLVFRRSPHAA